MAKQAAQGENPFPGLRAFEPSETHLFFGRDGQGDELLRMLARNRFVAVVGTSGSGKSSLVKAGVVAALRSGLMTEAGSSWRVSIMRPGASPIAGLAESLNSPRALGHGDLEASTRHILIETTLRRSSFGLLEAVRQAWMDRDENLLVLVDQFEEIFRLRTARRRVSAAEDEAAAFVKLLLEGTEQTELPIYVIITMRSDFLGDCAEFRGLPEALNRSQYLIPRMTRSQRKEAIEGPVAVGGATIAPRLVQRLLNDAGDDPDQLPILQHALMRTWNAWRGGCSPDSSIDLQDYEHIGGMTTALSRHADEAFDELDAAGKAIAQRLFQRLSDQGPGNRETRRPMRLLEICAIAEATENDVIATIDRFRTGDRTFLIPPANEKLSADSVIDISHESLIRLWNRLREWVDEEAESASLYRRLADTAARHKADRAALWRDPELQLALDWRDHEHPNQAWAARYDPNFGDAIKFLEKSRRWRSVTKGIRYATIIALLLGTGMTGMFLTRLVVSVPALPVGLDYSDAERWLQSIGLKAKNGSIELTGSDSTSRVLDQEPKAGSIVLRGQVVTIILSQETPYPLLCRGLRAISDNSSDAEHAAQNSHVLHFHKAAAIGAINLNPGECSFADRPLHSDEPALMFVGEHFDELSKASSSLNSLEYMCVINDIRKHRFDVVLFKSYNVFREGAWQPRNGDICGD